MKRSQNGKRFGLKESKVLGHPILRYITELTLLINVLGVLIIPILSSIYAGYLMSQFNELWMYTHPREVHVLQYIVAAHPYTAVSIYQ